MPYISDINEFNKLSRDDQYKNVQSGLDMLKNVKIAEPKPAAPVSRTPGLLDQAKAKATSTQDIYKRAQRQADTYAAQMRQARIDAINASFAPKIAREQEEGAGRMSRVAALNFNKGIVGSGVDTTATAEQKGLNNKALEAIEAEKAIAINEAFNKADELGRLKAQDLTAQYKDEAEGNIARYQGQYDKAAEAIKLFGGQGVTLEQLEKSDPNTIKTLMDVGGLSRFEIENMLTANNPQAKVLKTEVINGKVLNVVQNPDGTISANTYDTDISDQEDFQIVDGVGYGVTRDGNGNLQLRKLTEKQYAPKGTGLPGGVGGALSPLAQAVQNGSIALKDLTPTQRGQVAAELAQAGTTPDANKAKQKAQDIIAAATQLLESNYGRAVGPISSKLPTLTGAKADAQTYYTNLKALLTLDNLSLMKGTGPLSDSDLKVLSGAATPLDLGMSEEAFKNEVWKIRNTAQKVLNGGTSEDTTQLNPGEIMVMTKDGQIGAIPEGEFDPNIYTRI